MWEKGLRISMLALFDPGLIIICQDSELRLAEKASLSRRVALAHAKAGQRSMVTVFNPKVDSIGSPEPIHPCPFPRTGTFLIVISAQHLLPPHPPPPLAPAVLC